MHICMMLQLVFSFSKTQQIEKILSFDKKNSKPTFTKNRINLFAI